MRTAIDWQGKRQPKPKPDGKLIAEFQNVELWQNRKRFAVVYGLQLKADLTYAAAAKEFGECVLHSLACDSKLAAES